MKRLLLAVMLAVALHGLLLAGWGRRLKPQLPPIPHLGTVSLALISEPSPAPSPRPLRAERAAPVSEPAARPEPPALPERPADMEPRRQKTPVRKETAPLPPAEPAPVPPLESPPAVDAAGQESEPNRSRESQQDRRPHQTAPPEEETSLKWNPERAGEGQPENPAGPAAADEKPAAGPVQLARPLYRLNPEPPYPAMARRRRYEGTVLLEVLVAEDGRAGEVKVAESSGYALLDRAALETVRDWRFEPGRRHGRPVEMRVVVPIIFRLRE